MCLLENAEAQMLGSPSVSRGQCYAQLVLKQLRASLLEGREEAPLEVPLQKQVLFSPRGCVGGKGLFSGAPGCHL